MSRAKSTVVLSLIFLGAAFLTILLWNLTFSSTKEVLPKYLIAWNLATAFILLLKTTIPVQAAAIALSFSTGKPVIRKKGRSTAAEAVTILGLSLTLILCVEFFLPAIIKNKTGMQSSSLLFKEALNEAETALKRGDTETARGKAAVCASVDRYDPRYLTLEEAVEKSSVAEGKRANSLRKDAKKPEETDASKGKTANDYYLEALEYFEGGDYYSANWSASMSYELDRTRIDAQRLAATAWEKVRTLEPSAGDKESYALYAAKKTGYEKLRSGDPIGAYGVFKNLIITAPKDPDIKKYLAESLSALRKIAFFRDEALEASSKPDAKNLLFLTEGPGGYKSFIACARVAARKSLVYFVGMDYAKVLSGSVVFHVRSPFAVLDGKRLILVSVDRNSPDTSFSPDFIVGSPPDGVRNLIDVDFGPDEVLSAAKAFSPPDGIFLPELYSTIRNAGKLGMDVQALRAELMRRIFVIFAFLVVSLFAAATGSALRNRSETPIPVPARIFGVLAIFSSYFFVEAYAYINRVVISVLLQTIGFEAALVAFIILQVCLLLAAAAAFVTSRNNA